MAQVVPTVLATTPDEYAMMFERANGLSQRVHVDICDGDFADNRTVGLAQIHPADEVQLDLHLMLKDPASQLETALSLHPSLIIFHAESDGNIAELGEHTRELGVKAGVALLPQTSPESASELISSADHVLIFTGQLGHNGGSFQEEQLGKVASIRAINPDVEISVDGGVSDHNAALITLHGVDVLYVGGFLQSAEDPEAAFAAAAHQTEVQA